MTFHAPLEPGESLRELTWSGAESERLDRALAAALGLSRRRCMQLVEEDRVRLNGKRVPKGATVSLGARLTVRLPPADAPTPQPDLPIGILHADPAVIVADKPAGMPSHPLKPGELGTAANALVGRFADLVTAGGSPREGGLVHRLDTATSGCLIAARTPEALAALRAQFDAHTVEKTYLALVEGHVHSEGAIDAAIAHDESDPRRVRVSSDVAWGVEHRARPARTLYAPQERLGSAGTAFTLLRVQIPTGVLHQIRAHLAHIGHPVVGDALYGGPAIAGLQRHFLHASAIAFDHPQSGQRLSFESPLPSELRDALARLR